jgi:D-2-hydroxyacid dehydrogenase (NADP+)
VGDILLGTKLFYNALEVAMIVSVTGLERVHCDVVERLTGEKILVYKNVGEAIDVLPEAEVILSWNQFDSAVLQVCRKLKWLFILSAGVEKLPFTDLLEKGVVVTNVSGIHGSQMAEQALGMMISFSRRLNRSMRNQLRKKWEPMKLMEELTGKNLCIIGAGSIGKEVARKAKAFDMRVVGLKKHVSPMENFDCIWGMDKLKDALEQADYTVLLTPLTKETYHIIGQNEFNRMKASSIFINMSRGNTVDEAALIEALQKGTIAGAGLDVFHEEPLPSSSPLWEMENVIITPHNAGQSQYYMKRATDVFIECLRCYRKGTEMPNRIDLETMY